MEKTEDQARDRYSAYVDEFGDASLRVQSDGVTTFYIVTAILVPTNRVANLNEAVDVIRSRHFGQGEMKSSNVGSNDKRRLKILTDLDTLNFRFVSLAVDKRRIRSDGLIHKKPFIKFIHRQLYSHLYQARPNLHAFADEHGRQSFQESFSKYIKTNVHAQADFFRRPHFEFVSSESNPLIQLADFIGGTVARLLDPKKEAKNTDELVDQLRKHATMVISWPPVDRPIARISTKGGPLDRQIRELALDQLLPLISSDTPESSGDEKAKRVVLLHLLYHFQFISDEEYIPTGELIDALEEHGMPEYSENQFRSRLIAKLRDEGVLLASSRKGYKIPSSVSDIMDFLNHADRQIYPMIQRLNRARTAIRLKADLDILHDERFLYLRCLLDHDRFSRLLQENSHPDEDESV